MYKKTLAAIAVLGTFAGSALASEVTLYGVVDYGMLYQNQEYSFNGVTEEKDDSLTMDSGINAASRFGIKGTEDLGNGYKISFKLENGFDADDGALGVDDKLFNREARLTVEGPWGELSAGRMGALGSAAGTYDTIFAIGDAFDGGDGDIFTAAKTDRYDNMLTYRSPKFAGMQVTAQYSLKIANQAKEIDDDFPWEAGEEGHNSANRYAGIALTGEYGALQAVVGYEQLLWTDELWDDFDDGQIVSLGANYDFGVAKVFAMGQYCEDAPFTIMFAEDFFNGYSLHTGVQVPLASGLLTAGIYYSDGELSYDEDDTYKSILGSVKYEYPLSARTSLYGSVGYGQSKNTYSHYYFGDAEYKVNLTQIYAGITHTF